MNPDCIFCKIVAKEVPVHAIYEDEVCYAFLDAHPVTRGHTLLIPKAHTRNLFDTPDETLAHLFPIAKRIANIIKQTVGAGGINIHMNNEPSAGQIVFHTHIHIIPRFEGDGLTHWKGAQEFSAEEQVVLTKEIQKGF